jgi:hypothetical protein
MALMVFAILVTAFLGVATLWTAAAGAHGCYPTAKYPQDVWNGTNSGGWLNCNSGGHYHRIDTKLKEQRGSYPDATVHYNWRSSTLKSFFVGTHTGEQRACFYSVAWTGNVNDGTPVRCI